MRGRWMKKFIYFSVVTISTAWEIALNIMEFIYIPSVYRYWLVHYQECILTEFGEQ